jgi:hypothetical protein
MPFLNCFFYLVFAQHAKGFVLDPKTKESSSKVTSILEAVILNDIISSSHFTIELQKVAR